MYRGILTFAIATLFLACQQSTDSSDQAKRENEENKIDILATSISDTLLIEKFGVEEFPSAIDGCACYYWLPDDDRAYIYVDDYARTAFIKVDGAFEELEAYDVYSDGGVIQQKCRSEHWGLEVDLKSIGQIDETEQYAGTLRISNIRGEEQVLKIKGECGC
ncbi:hypothetical protein [Jiulongibacter sp. NS-SX5]|uniref:hypothetical protein n=1 Tax=Jiulongibacter sp. NS-SX5 TaxID=3463854 RepID=UPI0040585E76